MLAAMKRHLSLSYLACALALPLLVWTACVDTDDGERVYYSTPCSDVRFHDILQCVRETGGAPPIEGEATPISQDPPYTCARACEDFIECGFVAPEDFEACTRDCLSDPEIDQTVLDCIRDNGCNSFNCF